MSPADHAATETPRHKKDAHLVPKITGKSMHLNNLLIYAAIDKENAPLTNYEQLLPWGLENPKDKAYMAYKDYLYPWKITYSHKGIA